MTYTIELVAMAPSGDVLIVRDRDGRYWLNSQFEGEQSELKTDADVDQAVSMGDLRVVRATFDSVSDLGRFVDEQVSLTPATGRAADEISSIYQAEILLAGALDWKTDGTPEALQIAADVITRLLESPPVLAQPEFQQRLRRELDDLKPAPEPARDPRLDELKADARKRFALAA